MFSLLVHAFSGASPVSSSMDMLAAGGGIQSLASFEKSDDFSGHSMLAVASISPELLEKEKQKAKQGYCETALWNCNDLWGP
jgi:hypothetical protein